jgi:putative spermidine/putrescine transport system substrate-binding protein
VAAKLPPSSAYDQIVFPTLDQQTALKQQIADSWDKVVGVTVAKK